MYRVHGNGEVRNFQTFKAAYDHAMTDPSFVISFNDHHWFRQLRSKNDKYLIRNFPNYENCDNPDELFWICESTDPDDYENKIEDAFFAMCDASRTNQFEIKESIWLQLKERKSCIINCERDEQFRKYMQY